MRLIHLDLGRLRLLQDLQARLEFLLEDVAHGRQRHIFVRIEGFSGGTGAAREALNADKDVTLTAMGDVFEEKLKTSLEVLQKAQPAKVQVDEAHRFVGLDAVS